MKTKVQLGEPNSLELKGILPADFRDGTGGLMPVGGEPAARTADSEPPATSLSEASAPPPVPPEPEPDPQPSAAHHRMRVRFTSFMMLKAEAEQFLNPFADHTAKPLPLVACYILWCIDELPAAESARLLAPAAGQQPAFHQASDWQNMVSSAFALDEEWRRRVKMDWDGRKASQTQFMLSPIEFAKQVMETTLGL